jgi:endonuclease/exonuclease/phosphatase family metal-dependent hydrolase
MATSAKPAHTLRVRAAKWIRGLIGITAVGYVLALLAVIAVLRVVGESWWMSAVVLYLPRILWGIPLPILVVALIASGLKKLLWTQAVAALLILFPLMGFVLPGLNPRTDGPAMRVLSFNVNTGFGGYQNVAQQVLEQSADVVLLQEMGTIHEPERLTGPLEANYPHFRWDDQFFIASRYPIVSVFLPEKLELADRLRSPRFVSYVIDTPLGRLSFYNVHPASPRSAFYQLRGPAGLRRNILSGGVFTGPGKDKMAAHMALLTLQIQTAADLARKEPHPVIISGDLNLATLSPAAHAHLDDFQDGFEQAGWGFGHTFPNREGPLSMWLRLDRILASRDLVFVAFKTTCNWSSDHYCVVAELQRR